MLTKPKIPVLLLLTVFMVFSVIKVKGQNSTIDSLQQLVKKQKKDAPLIDIYYQLNEAYINVPDSSLKYLKEGIDLSRNLKLYEKEHQGLNLLSSHWFLRGDSKKSMHAIELALDKNESSNILEKIKTFDNYGKVLFTLARHEEAAAAHIKSLELSEEIIDSLSMVISLNNLGNIYRYLGESNKALNYYEKALEISLKKNYKSYIASCFGNLGIVYRATNKPKKALNAYKESIEMHREMGEKFHLAIGLMNLGVYYESLEQFVNAKECHLESNKISKEIKDDIGVALTLINLAIIETKTKNYRKAIGLLDSSLILAKNIEYKEGYKHIYLAYSETYSSMGNYRAAYQNRKSFEQWKDSVSNERYLQKVTELETKYETEKKEKDILSLSAEKIKNEAAIENQQTRIKNLSLSLLGLALLFAAAFIIFKQRTNNKKQQELIAAIADTQIEERKRIAQDLHDGVGGTLALTKNKLESLLISEKEKSKEITEFLETLSQTGDQIRQISHNMMPGELVKFGLVSAVQTTLDQIDDESLKTYLYTHDLDNRIDQTKEIHTFRIIQEIVQNVLKHAKASTLNVHLNKYAKKLSLLVEDDGIGFAYNDQNLQGIGLKNIKNRVANLKGKLNVDSGIGKGTTYNIEIPL